MNKLRESWAPGDLEEDPMPREASPCEHKRLAVQIRRTSDLRKVDNLILDVLRTKRFEKITPASPFGTFEVEPGYEDMLTYLASVHELEVEELIK